jgi:hypothetical protein
VSVAEGAVFQGSRRIAGCCGRSLGGEAFGDEPLVRRRFHHIRRRRGSFYLDLGEQPDLNRGGCPPSLRTIAGEIRGLGGGRATAEGLIESGNALIGSPETVLAGIERIGSALASASSWHSSSSASSRTI